MPTEKFPSQEPSPENQEVQKRKWGKLRTFALAGSLLVNGGFLAEQAHDKLKVENLDRGVKQTFSIEQGDTQSSFRGDRGEFSLQKGENGHWILTGKIYAYEKDAEENEMTHPLHEVTYELPALPPEAAEAIFADIEKAAKEEGPNGNVNAFMNRLIESAQKGTIVEYEARTHLPMHKLEVDMSEGKPPMATETVLGADEKGESKVFLESKIPLENLNTHVDFKDKEMK